MREAFGFLLFLAIGGFVVTAAGKDRPPIIITAPAHFDDSGLWIGLPISEPHPDWICIVSETHPDYTFFFPNPGGFVLESNRVYTFTFVEEPIKQNRLKKELFVPRISRIEQAGKMIYDREACEVHHSRMERKEVRIIYGLVLPGPDAPSPDTERRLFPHGQEILLGGCISTPDRPTGNIYVCSECKKAYAKWKADNARTP